MDDSAITCDEIIDVEAKLYDEEAETVFFNEKKVDCKTKCLYFTCLFIN